MAWCMVSGHRSIPPGHSTQPKSGLIVTALKMPGSSNFRNTPPRRSGSTAYETIRATVHFPDGHTASELFPYAWVYPDATNTDPWSPRNLRDPDFPARAQLPPPGTDLRRYPEVIRYILEHTRGDGTTVLQECPIPR